MKKQLAVTAALSAALLLSACSGTAAQGAGAQPPGGPGGQPPTGQRPGMSQEEMQSYVAAANAAPDKTVLTKDEFTAEMNALREKQMAGFQQTRSTGSSSSENPRIRWGTGGQLPPGQTPGGMMGGRIQTATTFLKYTDGSGSEVLLALDGSGNVVLKWPMQFRPGGRGGFGRPGMNASSASSAS